MQFMSAAKNEVPTSLRLPADLLERADRLAERLDKLPEFALARATRTSILRLAILRGLDALEQEAKGRK